MIHGSKGAHRRARPDDGEVPSGWHLDGLAISASALCLLHCLALPVAIAFLPALSTWLNVGELFHVLMLAIAIPLSGLTLILGWRRHGSVAPVVIGTVGLALLVAGLGFEGRTSGTVLTVAGGLVLALAHVHNLRAANMARLAAL
ncbi:MerC domain-containing protein [Sphingomonas sp. PB1R3]|uniref:MerC domain-containing protein n=1 Tax=Sphingomonas flavida TaxID=3096154 RepID=UPI002FCC9390